MIKDLQSVTQDPRSTMHSPQSIIHNQSKICDPSNYTNAHTHTHPGLEGGVPKWDIEPLGLMNGVGWWQGWESFSTVIVGTVVHCWGHPHKTMHLSVNSFFTIGPWSRGLQAPLLPGEDLCGHCASRGLGFQTGLQQNMASLNSHEFD